MKKIFLYSFTLASLAVACNKVEPTPSNSNVEPTLEGRMITETISGCWNSSTKATIADADASFKWSVGDNIAVHVSNNSGGHMYVFTSGEGGASVAAASASFTVSYPENYTRDAFAVFPRTIVKSSAANYGQDEHTLDVTLPASYTLAQVSGETSPCPMIATNTAGSGWTFYQLCSLLRLTVSSIPSNAKRLEIDFDGKQVCGAFSISSPNPGTSTIATTADPTHDKITVTKDETDVVFGETSLVLNIPLPTGNYSGITVVAYNSIAGGDPILVGTVPFGYTATITKGVKKTSVLKYGVFSVGSSKRVIFAPGNLRATYAGSPAAWSWSFAPNQYDYIGAYPGNTKVNGNGSLSETGTLDLFGFSTSQTYFGISNSWDTALFSGTFIDWGNNSINGYGTNYWCTLSEPEWQYVVGEETSRYFGADLDNVTSAANALFTKATVMGKKGLILFPDHYSGFAPTGITWNYDFISPGHMKHSNNEGWGTTINNSEDWAALENVGCVFLPVTGFRAGYYGVYYIENGKSGAGDPTGYYMASTPTSGNIRVLRISGSSSTPHGVDPNQDVNRGYACAVRLVHVID